MRMKSILPAPNLKSDSEAAREFKGCAQVTNLVGIIVAIMVMYCQVACSQDSKMETSSIPCLRQTGHGAIQLFVNNKPYLALGGELGNSTASDLDVLESALARCQRMNLNTV